MSLAPDERRTLARIEDSLSRSDPRLAAWLTTFTLPVWLRLTVGCRRAIMRASHLARPPRWTARLAVLVAGLAVVSLMVAGMVALSRVRMPSCTEHHFHTSAYGPLPTCQRPGSGVGRSHPGASMTVRRAVPRRPASG